MNFFVPSTLSTTMPNITSEYMLKKMCIQPSCMNMWVRGCHQRNSVESGKAMEKVPFMNTGLMRVAMNMITFT